MSRSLLPLLLALMPGILPASASVPGNPPDKGMWIWFRENVADPSQRAAMLTFAGSQGINRLLVNIHFDGAADHDALGTYADPLQNLLKEAGEKGYAVEALTGAPDMGFAVNRAKTLHQLDILLTFNKTQPPGARFVGIHYDIEPYLTPRWKGGDIPGAVSETLETLSEIRDHVRNSDPSLTVAYDIPSWYGTKPPLQKIAFHGVTKSLQEHVQDLSDYVGVMAYRRAATGPNSVTALCAPIFAYAEKTGKRVYPAMESKKLDQTPNITFYGTSPEIFEEALNQIWSANSKSPAFGGVLLHQYVYLHTLLGDKTEAKP
ncbi:MAG TPA: hypothetical protein VGC39_06070 [Candidatus Methylacidiphilales bacterium]